MKQKYFTFILVAMLVLLAAWAFAPAVAAQAPSPGPGPSSIAWAPLAEPIQIDVLDVVGKIALGFASLIGVSGLVAALVSLGKVIKIVKDGTADKWAAGLNLLCFIVLVVFGVFRPDLATNILDGYAGQIAMIILFVLGFITQITGSKPMYDQLKAASVPLIGKSFSSSTDA
jgi:hypothetical protein